MPDRREKKQENEVEKKAWQQVRKPNKVKPGYKKKNEATAKESKEKNSTQSIQEIKRVENKW